MSKYSGNGSNQTDVSILRNGKRPVFDQYDHRIRKCRFKYQLTILVEITPGGSAIWNIRVLFLRWDRQKEVCRELAALSAAGRRRKSLLLDWRLWRILI
jgi:hypothetical protein